MPVNPTGVILRERHVLSSSSRAGLDLYKSGGEGRKGSTSRRGVSSEQWAAKADVDGVIEADRDHFRRKSMGGGRKGCYPGARLAMELYQKNKDKDRDKDKDKDKHKHTRLCFHCRLPLFGTEGFSGDLLAIESIEGGNIVEPIGRHEVHPSPLAQTVSCTPLDQSSDRLTPICPSLTCIDSC